MIRDFRASPSVRKIVFLLIGRTRQTAIGNFTMDVWFRRVRGTLVGGEFFGACRDPPLPMSADGLVKLYDRVNTCAQSSDISCRIHISDHAVQLPLLRGDPL
jgi:hypothetical protein